MPIVNIQMAVSAAISVTNNIETVQFAITTIAEFVRIFLFLDRPTKTLIYKDIIDQKANIPIWEISELDSVVVVVNC